MPDPETGYDFPTLPDYLAPDLDIVFIGINPSVISVSHGHYFFRKTNRFWPAFSQSRLSLGVRQVLQRDAVGPEDDRLLLEHGFGFTDVVKRPSPNANALTPADYAEWAPRLLARLEPIKPRIACFHGVTGYRAFLRYALNAPKESVELGPQTRTLAGARIFVAPNPSPANAHFRLQDQVDAYERLADLRDQLRSRAKKKG